MNKEIIEEFINNSTITKSIHSKEIKDFLSTLYTDKFENNLNRTLKQKLNMYVFALTDIPKCSCGNSLPFVSETKATLYKTKFGGWREFCSVSCSRSSSTVVNRRKASCLEKYGETSFAKTQKFKEQFSIPWSEEKKQAYNEKRIITNIQKYGVEHFSKTDEYIKNRTKTCLKKYKVDNCFQLRDKVVKGQQETLNGNVSWTQTARGKNFFKTNNPMFLESVKQKSAFNRFLSDYSSKNVDKIFISIIQEQDKDKFINLIDNLYSKHNKCKYSIAEELNIGYSTLCRYIREFDLQDRYISPNGAPSKAEREIYHFVKSFDVQVRQSNRTVLSGKELDIYVPDKKLAIELNGVYYHSEYTGNKDKLYHVNKTILCEQQGVQLLHIFDTEWNDPKKQSIWKSIIAQKLGFTTNKIFARKTIIKDISSKEAKQFFDTNHLSGFVGAKYHKALLFNGEIICAISISDSRFGGSDSYEIIRFASKLNYSVVGGLSKLVKSFNLDKPLMTFADRRISSPLNSCYLKLFETVEILSPSWFGFSRKDYVLNHRLSYTKNKLKLKINYDDNLSVFDNMIRNNYDRIWDCGNLKFTNFKV